MNQFRKEQNAVVDSIKRTDHFTYFMSVNVDEIS